MKATIFDGSTQRPFTSADAAALSSTTPYAWVDVLYSEPKDPEVLGLLQQMGFSDIVANYTTRSSSRGMFQAFGDNMLACTFAAGDDDGPPVLVQCVWNTGCLVTIRRGADQAIATALNDLKPTASRLFEHPGPVPGIVMQLVVDSIGRQLTQIQTEVGFLDGQIILTSKPSQLEQLQQLRAPLTALGTTMPPYLENLRECLLAPASLPGMDTTGVQALQTYAACVTDIVQEISSAAGDVRNAIEDYQGQVSSAQGGRINQLTLVSTIFLPISFLTGYFGQNFQYLTNETLSFASWFALGVVLPITVVLVSVVLLRKGGFSIGRPARFHLRHRPPQKDGASTS